MRLKCHWTLNERKKHKTEWNADLLSAMSARRAEGGRLDAGATNRRGLDFVVVPTFLCLISSRCCLIWKGVVYEDMRTFCLWWIGDHAFIATSAWCAVKDMMSLVCVCMMLEKVFVVIDLGNQKAWSRKGHQGQTGFLMLADALRMASNRWEVKCLCFAATIILFDGFARSFSKTNLTLKMICLCFDRPLTLLSSTWALSFVLQMLLAVLGHWWGLQLWIILVSPLLDGFFLSTCCRWSSHCMNP